MGGGGAGGTFMSPQDVNVSQKENIEMVTTECLQPSERQPECVTFSDLQ